MSTSLTTIPLCQLKRSRLNVRKTDPLTEIEALAASIEIHGLLENLIVRPTASDEHFEVVAGGRRLAALKLLAKRKKIERDHGISCLVLEIADTGALISASLAENIIRAPVHPADQFEAFATLRADGLGPEEIAARFGVTAHVVVQRLKLAAISPRLMAEYRKEAMTLDQMMAFAISDDHAAQEAVWFDNGFGDTSPQAIRRRLTSAHVEGADRRALFVGAKAYEQAGGVILRDLFDPENEGYFTDSVLLDRLASEKLKAEADAVKAEGWGWVEIVLRPDFDRLARFGRVHPVEVPLSEKDEARLSVLSERYDELVCAPEEDRDNDEASDELDRIQAEIEAMQAKSEVWLEEAKADAGAIVSLEHDGAVRIDRGLKKVGERNRAESDVETSERSGKKSPCANGYSESLLADLSAHRTAALREMLANRPDKALTALLHALVLDIFFPGFAGGCIEITAHSADLGSMSKTVGESRACAALLARREQWAMRFPEADSLWDWLEGIPPVERHELLAFCTAMTIDAIYRRQGEQRRLHQADRLARAIGLDMAEWWAPTRDFLNRINKDQILKVVSEGVSPIESQRLAGLKKDQLVQRAEALLANRRWLPRPLKYSADELPVTIAEEAA